MERIFESDKEQVLKYLSNEPYFNIYMFGDICKFGLESDDVKIFVDCKEKIHCVLMDFRGDFVIYSMDNNFEVTQFSNYIMSTKDYAECCVSGKGSTIDILSNKLPEKKSRTTNLAVLENFTYLEYGAKHLPVKKLDCDDAKELLKLLNSIDEFKSKYANYPEEKVVRDMENGRVFGVFDGPDLIASAASTAESALCAMITNVCTHPKYRRLGYAEKILCVLIKSMLEDGIRNICLYYDNPSAAQLYYKLGFVEKGVYKTLR